MSVLSVFFTVYVGLKIKAPRDFPGVFCLSSFVFVLRKGTEKGTGICYQVYSEEELIQKYLSLGTSSKQGPPGAAQAKEQPETETIP